MFQLPEVEEILRLQREVETKKQELIEFAITQYSDRIETATPEQFRVWLAWCVRDPALIAEIWEVFERELAAYQERLDGTSSVELD